MILLSPNLIVVSDMVPPPVVLLTDEIFPHKLDPFWFESTPTERDFGVGEHVVVENVLRTIFTGSTRRAMQESSGAKAMELGLKS